MVARIEPCQRIRLREALDSALDARAENELAVHLEQCGACRTELERLAADESWWSGARELLPVASPQRPTARESDGALTRPDATSAARARSAVDDEPLTFLAPSDDPSLLGRLGAYDVCEVLGRGGFGLVLKAFDPALNRFVAIKVLTAELATSAAARRRFAREAQAAAAVVHEHVVPIHAVDIEGAVPYLVMAYVPGRSLQERIDQTGPLELKEILRIGLQAASGLAAAHAQGLVHRDVKPANILLENGVERVQLTDFGLARAVDDASMTQSGVIAGTPQYMSPEQARGEALDARADLFSLGSVFYAMATGHPPFRAENTLAVLRRICEGKPRPVRESNPELPSWFEAIVARLHAAQPGDRYADAAEVAALLERCLAHVQQPAIAPLPAELRRHRYADLWRAARWPMAVLAAAMLLAGAWAVLRAWNPPATPPKTEVAETRSARVVVTMNDVPATMIAQVWSAGERQGEVQQVEQEADALERRWHSYARSASPDPVPALERELDELELKIAGRPNSTSSPSTTVNVPSAAIVAPPERKVNQP